MDKRDLTYTTSDDNRGSARGSGEPETPPPMIGWRFAFLVILVGAALTAVGSWQVATVFELRDYEMEASRVQRLTQQRRDRAKTLEVRLSQLQGGESLRAAAIEGLGMQMPAPHTIQTIIVTQAVSDRWDNAARSVTGEEVHR